jgi:hypothetical protein
MKNPTPPEILSHLDLLIAKHGSKVKLAKALDTNAPVIQRWVDRKSVPPPWRQLLKKMKA